MRREWVSIQETKLSPPREALGIEGAGLVARLTIAINNPNHHILLPRAKFKRLLGDEVMLALGLRRMSVPGLFGESHPQTSQSDAQPGRRQRPKHCKAPELHLTAA